MLQSSVIEAGYRQKLIEDLEQKLADRGGERSGRRNERRRFNFLRNTARRFNQTKNTIAQNPFLSAVVGGIGLELLGNLFQKENKKAGGSGNSDSSSNNKKSASMSSSSNNNMAFNQNGRKLPNFGFSGPLSASAQPVSGMFNETNSFQDDVIDNSMTDIVDNLSLINEIMMPGSGSETTNISSPFGNKNFSSNMSLVGSASRFPVPVGSKSGITVLDLRTKSSDQPGNDISKSVPVFGSDVTSSEPSMGDWEIYLSKGRI